MGLIRLFISDIDGCLAEPYRPVPLEKWLILACRVQQAYEEHADRSVRPLFTVCSGRAYAYVEAITQVLAVQCPVLFEAGGGMFHLPEARIQWNEAFTPAIEQQLQEVAAWLKATCLPGTHMTYDFGKRTQAGIIGPYPEEVQACVPRVRDYVEARYPDLRVFYTHVSIDIVPAAITKVQGLHWLARETGIPLKEMAYIGDSIGDLEALRAVGHAFAPANATEEIKTVVDYVTRGTVIDGVLEAYARAEAHNRAVLATSP